MANGDVTDTAGRRSSGPPSEAELQRCFDAWCFGRRLNRITWRYRIAILRQERRDLDLVAMVVSVHLAT